MRASKQIFIRWMSDGIHEGILEIQNGDIKSITDPAGCLAGIDSRHVTMERGQSILKIEAEISEDSYGGDATIIKWNSVKDGFSFLPSTIPGDGVIYAEDLGVLIGHQLSLVQEDPPATKGSPKNCRGENDPSGRSIDWNHWAEKNIPQEVPVILGLSRDHRIFQIELNSDEPDSIQVRASRDLTTPTVAYSLAQAAIAGGRIERSLEDGYLPILHWSKNYGELLVEEVAFTSFIDRDLKPEELEGTPFSISHLFSSTATFPDGEREKAEAEALHWRPEGELVLFLRSSFTNCSDTPLLAVQRLPRACHIFTKGEQIPLAKSVRLDDRGVAWSDEVPYAMHRMNGRAPKATQPCLLLAPGESMVIESVLSHRGEGLSVNACDQKWSWEEKLAQVKKFWRDKLKEGTLISTPDPRLNSFWKAGRVHLELLTLGGQHDTPLLAKVGVYSAIGSESLPIVEYYDSVGLHDTARRCIDAFFDFQHAGGRINLYSYYDVESGASLFMAGRHFAYTRNIEWVKKRAASFKAAAKYILSLRCLDPEKPAYGLVAGTCADPIEPRTAFMLNSYNSAGLAAVAMMLEAIHDEDVAFYRSAAVEYRICLRKAFNNAFADGPLIPTTPNRWVPTCAPSVEGRGLQVMGLDGSETFTHRSYASFDALIGPLWAVYLGVIDFREPFANWLVEIHDRQMNRGALAESQPYYSRHPEVHLLRGERDAFLNAFYSGLTAMADRETFSFWEHLHKVSAHKTHEEGWALMQLRRMLWLEKGSELHLLAGVPDAWVDSGANITVEKAGTYFGTISFTVARSKDGRHLTLKFDADFHTQPSNIYVHVSDLNCEPVRTENFRFTSGLVEILTACIPIDICLALAKQSEPTSAITPRKSGLEMVSDFAP